MKNSSKKISFDILGNISLVKFDKNVSLGNKKKFAKEIIKKNKSVKTVLEKVGRFKGRLRKQETKYLIGEKTKEVLYRENDCFFRFNIDNEYFSSRLSNERKEISKKINKRERVFVMFAGVGPFSIIIAKKSNPKIVYSNEVNRDANKYMELNCNLNKVQGKVIQINGDIKRISKKLFQEKKSFDVIVMPRPNLKESFLKEAFLLRNTSGRNKTRVYYYFFCKQENLDFEVEKIKKEINSFGAKIKIINLKKAGEIAPYKFRFRIDFKFLN